MIAPRVQRSRKSKPGIPLGSVYVGRPSQWGNPAKIGEFFQVNGQHFFIHNNLIAVEQFYEHCKRFALSQPAEFCLWLAPLIDRPVCCWCNNSQPCHGDILRFLANYLRETLKSPNCGTVIAATVPSWPDLSDIIVLK